MTPTNNGCLGPELTDMCDDKDKLRPPNDTDGRVLGVERTEAGQLLVRLAGRQEPVVDVKVVRCFPWSVPGGYVSIHDSNDKEAAMLKTLDELDPTSRRIVEEELRDKIFNPKILRIVDFKDDFDVTSVTAETDRGMVTFQIRTRDDVRVLSDTRALFRDVDGNTYELPDLMALDTVGRKHLEQYF